MKLPYSWLSEYVDINVSIEELADKMLKVGFEVEEIIRQGEDIDKVVIGKILKIEPHTNSDHLQICQVDVTQEYGGVLQIVTGAQNIFENAVIPVAIVGATLPGDFKIKASKLRGVESYGMMCSGGELNLTESDYEGASVNGIMIMKDDSPLGVKITDFLDMNDVIFDVSITANRPDCQSIYGLAREVSALLNQPIKELDLNFEVKEQLGNIDEKLKVTVEKPDLCPKYMAGMVENIKDVETPEWMKKRLKSVGLRSISPFVDITNYILMELGQPMHAFDKAEILDNEIIVRLAKEGEKITILSGDEIELPNSALVICDHSKPSAIAGIMGGMNSGISTNSKGVIFESAKFARDCIRKTSKTIGVRSDSSSRYEKGIDVFTTDLALKRALALVYQMGLGDIVSGVVDCASEKNRNLKIQTPVEKIDALLGIAVPHSQILEILNSLSFESKIEEGVLTSIVPNYRTDVESYEDLAEEIIRYYGYEFINGTLLEKCSITNGGFRQDQTYLNNLKNKLVDLGYFEAITYSFTTPKYIDNLFLNDNAKHNNPVKLLNALGEDLSVMRTTLTHSMLNCLATNTKKSNEECRLFEIAKVYINENKELPREEETLCVGEYGENIDFYVTKSALETVFDSVNVAYDLVKSSKKFLHPGRSCDVVVNGEVIGYLGEVHPNTLTQYGITKRAVIMELNLETILNNLNNIIKFKPYSKFQASNRDLAIIVDEQVSMEQIVKIVKEKGGANLVDVKLFDIYRNESLGENKKSLAFTLKFSSLEKSLSEEEIESAINRILKKIKSDLGGTLR